MRCPIFIYWQPRPGILSLRSSGVAAPEIGPFGHKLRPQRPCFVVLFSTTIATNPLVMRLRPRPHTLSSCPSFILSDQTDAHSSLSGCIEPCRSGLGHIDRFDRSNLARSMLPNNGHIIRIKSGHLLRDRSDFRDVRSNPAPVQTKTQGSFGTPGMLPETYQ